MLGRITTTIIRLSTAKSLGNLGHRAVASAVGFIGLFIAQVVIAQAVIA